MARSSPTHPGRITEHYDGSLLLICIPRSRRVMWIEGDQAPRLLRWLGWAADRMDPHCGPRAEHIVPARSIEAFGDGRNVWVSPVQCERHGRIRLTAQQARGVYALLWAYLYPNLEHATI